MVQLKDIRDIEDLEIKSLDDVIGGAYKSSRWKNWEKIENDIINEGKAPSLSAYLLYEYQFNGRNKLNLAKEFNVSQPTMSNLMKKLKIPNKSMREIRKSINWSSPQSLDKEGELASFVNDYLNPNISGKELHKKHNISCASHFMNKAVDQGLITEKEYQDASSARRSKSAFKNAEIIRQTNQKLNDDELKALALDYLFFDDSKEELQNKYKIKAVTHFLGKARKLNLIDEKDYEKAIKRIRRKNLEENGIFRLNGENHPNFGKKHSEETKEKISSSHFTPEAIERDILRGIELAKKSKKQKWRLEGNDYDSMEEAATGILLEKYIPNFKVKEDETFQVGKISDDKTCGCIYDFIIPDAIIEWHPVNLIHDFDYISEAYQEYEELKKEFKTPEDKIDLNLIRRGLEDDVATEYWFKKQYISDNSDYNGKEVILARDFNELYDLVLTKYGKEDLPSKRELRKEFNGLMKEAELIKPKTKVA